MFPILLAEGMSIEYAVGVVLTVMGIMFVPGMGGLLHIVIMLYTIKTRQEAHEQSNETQWKRIDRHSDLIVELGSKVNAMHNETSEAIRTNRHEIVNGAAATYMRKDVYDPVLASMASDLKELKTCED